MGSLNYAGPDNATIEIDDRTLAHLKFVIVTKLRRGEGFTFSWLTDDGGRSSIWVTPEVSLEFHFLDPTPAEMNREWLDALAQAASSASGLTALPEPPSSK